ncbi:hypothetical protein IFM89_010994 [Coptis chinensis]|uniref:Glycosyltransferase n=1 Tax=Coptis chinensis TaxID=261450 RepID=A0A835MAW5_9MAGN|nr:hypothetical protein IFM89_010994 [Coptis chinensis]
MLSIPTLGHLIPFLELAKRIVAFDGFKVSLLVLHTDTSPAIFQLLNNIRLPKGLEIVKIPPVDISSFVDACTDIVTRISIIMRESLPQIESVIINLARATILVVDLFAKGALDLAADNLCVQKYIFLTSPAGLLAFMMYLPTLDQEVDGEFVDLKEPIHIPGCNPIQVDDLVDRVLNRKVEEYTWFLYHASRFPIAHGVLVNTCEDLEPTSLKALKENPVLGKIPTPPVYPVGPLIKAHNSPAQLENKCITWLDMQPKDSVLFVSFGSGGTLSAEQMIELAYGLELSQQRFIWVVKKPVEANNSAGTLFTTGNMEHTNPCDYLPNGFLTSINGVGLVVQSWAPQVEILSHKSTGGFLSHCGWNSTLESIVNGVPVITWPLFAEQKMNATFLVEELGVAIRPSVGKDKELVGRVEIGRVVRKVMENTEEGNGLRNKVMEIQNSVLKALDEGGSSYNSLSQVLQEWKTNCIVDKIDRKKV